MPNRENHASGQFNRRLGTLIDKLGPINNACRSATGIEKVELFWDMGDTLLRIAPDADDNLLWAINERSYLTRNLLRYALIIRRSWPDRAELRKMFPRLSQYSLFREALPFLKDDRCGISEDEYRGIVARLNDGNIRDTKQFLQNLKVQKIGRGHKKGQAVAKMSQCAESVRGAIRRISEIAASNPAEAKKLREETGPDALLTLSQWCMAVAEDAALRAEDLNIRTLPEPLAALVVNLLTVSQANRI